MNRLIPIAAAALLTLGGITLWQSMQTGPEATFELPGMAVAQSAFAVGAFDENGQLTDAAQDRLATLTRLYGRVAQLDQPPADDSEP